LLWFKVLRAWGASLPALCTVVCLFRAGPRKILSPMDPPGKGALPYRTTTRARAQNTPETHFPLPQVHTGGQGWGDGDEQRPRGDPGTLPTGVGVGGLGWERGGAAYSAPA